MLAGGARPSIAQEPQATAPEGFTYRAEGRRDPFVSLVRRGTAGTPRSRARGLAGLATSEVSLRGTVLNQGSVVGILEGVDGRTYIVRPGDKLADGTIRDVSADALIVAQPVVDPLAQEKEREVRKLLQPASHDRQ
jgi:Tfp pilus assembly protein PilP